MTLEQTEEILFNNSRPDVRGVKVVDFELAKKMLRINRLKGMEFGLSVDYLAKPDPYTKRAIDFVLLELESLMGMKGKPMPPLPVKEEVEEEIEEETEEEVPMKKEGDPGYYPKYEVIPDVKEESNSISTKVSTRALIEQFLEITPGQEFHLNTLVRFVKKLKPTSKESSIMATFSAMKNSKRIQNVERGVYRICMNVEETAKESVAINHFNLNSE